MPVQPRHRQRRTDCPEREVSELTGFGLPWYHHDVASRGSTPGQRANVRCYVEVPKKSWQHPGLPNQIWPGPSHNLAQPGL